jgi:hypothetical protein
MAEEGKGVAMAILGIVAVIAVMGLVLLFKGASGNAAGYLGESKIYPGKVVLGETGPGFDYAGEGAYVTEQKGSCLSTEIFVQDYPYSPETCRPGEMRVETYQRSRKFFGAPDQSYVVKGYCCPRPYESYPEFEE